MDNLDEYGEEAEADAYRGGRLLSKAKGKGYTVPKVSSLT